MAALKDFSQTSDDNTIDKTLFGLIADDIEKQGYSIRHGALPEDITSSLYSDAQCLNTNQYTAAGVGRGEKFLKTEFVRTDEICWITDASDAGVKWIDWTSRLQRFLNQKLFLGLFSFESHYAHYAPGSYYKRHYDAFRGEANRVLSVVTYLNPAWVNSDQGELVIYADDHDRKGLKVVPLYGTIVVFLSEEFPHEVLQANRDRYSVAGWFRVNTSINNQIDPPI